MTTETKYTPEDLLALPDGERFELVDGELVEREMSMESSVVAIRLATLIRNWVASGAGGWVFGWDGGLRIFPWSPDALRRADVGYVAPGKATWRGQATLSLPPDLLVEVISPNDVFSALEEKVADYLRAGVRLVWVVVPETRWVHVYRLDGSVDLVREGQELDGGDVLPGFRCPVADLFADD